MSDLPPKLKPPTAVDTLAVDVTSLLAEGEDVSGTPVWSVVGAPAGDASPLTVSGDSYEEPYATTSIAAGTLRETYQVQCLITTDAGRSLPVRFTVRIGPR